MNTPSRIAFYAGWGGIAVIVVFVGLLLFRLVDVPSLAVALPLALGYGALRMVQEDRAASKRIVILTDLPRAGSATGQVSRWFRDLIARGDVKLLYESRPSVGGGAAADPADWVNEQIRELKTGRLEIDARAKARVGREEKVIVAIAKAEHDRILAAVAEGRQHEAHAIKVNAFMRVELHGDAFEIRNPPIQDKLVTDDQPALWEFKIVPRKSGTQTLVVLAIVRLRLPGGGEEYYELKPQPRQIVVRVGPVAAVRQAMATPYVKFAVGAWTVVAATFGAVYGIDPLKEKINALLKPYVDWLFG
jgi:hypothetical protein